MLEEYVDARPAPAPGQGRRHEPGAGPLIRQAPEPPPPDGSGASEDADDSLEPGDALFGVGDVGVDEQLGFWN